VRAAGLLLAACLAADAAAAQTVVPVRPLRAQTVIGPADVALEEQATPGALTTLDQAIGREARETLYPGRPVLAAQVGLPAVIERNQVVRMSFALGALAISTEGRALDRGAVGETIRVMNLSSRQIVTGEVAQDGTIEVGR
jgi:flagellar basal body P-ring formation protein FlgA